MDQINQISHNKNVEARATELGHRRSHKREGGVALLIAVMMLTIMGLMGMGSMETTMRDRQVAGFQGRARAALYAADAGIAWGRGIVYRDIQLLLPEGIAALHAFDPTFPTTTTKLYLGPGSTDQPYFIRNPDPAITQAMDYVGQGYSCDEAIMSDEVGGTQWREALFLINVEGRTAETDNAARRIEATATYCYPYEA